MSLESSFTAIKDSSNLFSHCLLYPNVPIILNPDFIILFQFIMQSVVSQKKFSLAVFPHTVPHTSLDQD